MTNGNEQQESKFDVLRQYPILAWDYPKLVVYVPMERTISYAPEVFPNFIEIARQGVPFLHLPYGFADRMRNEAVKHFLKSKYTHIVMLDLDHAHPQDIVQRLAYHVIDDPDKMVVGGINFKRSEPFSPCVGLLRDGSFYRPWEWTQGIAEVDRIGFGCVIIAREAFERTEFPWFVNEPNMHNQMLGSHDNYFCDKAQAAGIKVWCDFSLSSPHIATHRVTEQTFRTYYDVNPIAEEELIDA